MISQINLNRADNSAELIQSESITSETINLQTLPKEVVTLEAKNLHLSVKLNDGSSCVLRDISFKLPAAGSLGLVGESGAGKSMLGRVLSRQLPENFSVTSGELLFAGKDLLNISEEQHRHLLGDRIAFIPQEPMTALNPVLTIGQQFTEHLLRLGTPVKECEEIMNNSLTAVMLPNPQAILEKYAFQLSGGMCQRILIALAFVSKPELVIADEATTALDPVSQAQVVRLLKILQEKEGTAVLFVTHDMGLATHVCDDVAVLYAGEIMENIKASELFSAPGHPYTQALKASTPSLTGPLSPLASLDGQMPGVESFPSLQGCRFINRCEFSTTECSKEKPPFTNLAPQHTVRCIKVTQILAHNCAQKDNNKIHTPGKAFSNAPIMTATNLTKIYPAKKKGGLNTHAVKSANIEIASGEFIGIVGGSGSGKSTLAKLIMGLETPTSGDIVLNGKKIGADKNSWNKRISLIQMIFQDARSALNPNHKVQQLLTQSMNQSPFRSLTRKKRAIELALNVGISIHTLLRYPSQLSGGQRQRVNIGRSLCDVPQILIADEIVSGLDVSVQANIMNLLLKLRQEHKFSLILISHDLAVVRYLCDKIMVMQNGEIVERGYTEDVLSNPQHPYTHELIQAIPTTDSRAIWPPTMTEKN
jgi:peptide/nickel transport system ATP-binding protein